MKCESAKSDLGWKGYNVVDVIIPNRSIHWYSNSTGIGATNKPTAREEQISLEIQLSPLE